MLVGRPNFVHKLSPPPFGASSLLICFEIADFWIASVAFERMAFVQALFVAQFPVECEG